MVCFENGKITDARLPELLKAGGDASDGQYICLLPLDEFIELNVNADLVRIITEEFQNHSNINAKFETHEGFQLLYMSVPTHLARADTVSALSVCLSARMLLAVYVPWDPAVVQAEPDPVRKIIEGHLSRTTSLSGNLIFLLDMFTREDSHVLQDIERKITDLEDNLITSYENAYIHDIVDFRKELLPLKRYYEQLIALFEGLDDNENALFSALDMKHCGNVANRVDRLYHTVLNLRDYVTQVREAYQSQADLSLNNIMKVLTVMTSVFLPLTLLAGWYGMNLKMPEFDWDYGYPFVISLSVAIAVGCILMFRKNKWF